MSKLRKIFTLSVMLVTILSMSVVVVPEVGAAATAGDLIKMDGLSSVYYLGADGKRYVFPNEATYFSWYGDFSGVVTIPQSELESYPLGANVTMRAGTKLVKITTDPKVYAVQPDGKLLWVSSEATATTLYGANWAKRVVDVPDAFFTNYAVLTGEVSASAYPAGSLVKFSGADVYYINADGTASKVANEAAFLANRFKWNDVITATIAMPATGADITGADANLIDTSEGGGAGTGITPGAGTGLTVALASDTPAAGTTLSDATGTNQGQALVPVTKVNFTAAADGAVKVNTLKFKRAGVPSSDNDFVEYYLYDGNTLVAKYNSISDGILTFTNGSGLFTVPAGATKSITLKVNLDAGLASSRAYNFSVLSAGDIATDGATVSGSFPMTGNTMTTAQVGDLGELTIAKGGSISAPDPGTIGHTIFSFKADAADQKINIEKLKFTIIGTVDATDLTNFKLNVAGAQIGSTVASMSSDKTVTFDLSASPYQLDKGSSKNFDLTADVVGGTNRTFQVYFYNKEDIVAKDVEYGVYVTPNQADTWTKVSIGSDTTISTGSLTVSKNTTSPSGNIAMGSTGVEIGKFDFKAVGEAIKVDSVYIFVNTSASNDGLQQVKLFVDGSQIGTATNLAEAAGTGTEVSCGNSFIIPAGTTKTLVVKANMKDDDGGALTANETISFQLGTSKSTDYTRQTTGTTGTTGAISANVLTVKNGTLSAAENTSFGDRSATLPTGVVNATGVKIASFTVTAGAGEAVTITQLALQDYAATTLMGNNFQNLKLMHGTTQLGATKGNLNTSSVGTYTFNPSPAIKLGAGQQYVVDVYADIKSSAAQTGMTMYGINFYSVTATGDTTNSDASFTNNSTPFELQKMYIASVGNLNISDDANTPVAQQLVMGTTDQEVAKFKLEASTSENIDITQLTISDTVSAAATGTLQNVSIWDGATKIAGPVQLETVAATGHANATFTGFNLTIPAGGSKTLTVKADVTSAANGGTSGSTHTFGILVDDGVAGETIIAKGAQSGTVLTDTDNTIDYYSKTDSAVDADQTGSQMTAYRTKISAAWASDTPSGASVGSSAQTIAKINITNSANEGNYTAIVKNVNLALSTTISNTANRTLTIYKDNLSTTALGSTTWLASLNQNFADTVMVDANMTDVEIAAGETKTFLFTLDTTNANATGDFSLSVNMAAGDIAWDDSAGTTITSVNSLPLTPKTMTY